MKNWKKFTALFAAALTLCLFASCSNSAGGGGSNTAPQETTPTPAPVPNPVMYTITFNANDGSENPATARQTFKAGTPKALKSIATLGFSKNGYNFAGWGTTANATQASYADIAEYTASSNVTLYALWSAVPVYSVNIQMNSNGSVIATPATAAAGKKITLSNTPNEGYNFASYIVTDADGLAVTVTDGTFTMPAKKVTVAATFCAINYNIKISATENGSVTASSETAIVGTNVTLTASPASGFELETLTVTPVGETAFAAEGTGNTRIFSMPAKNVTVTATFRAIKYNIYVGTYDKGSVTSSHSTATVGTTVTLTAKPSTGYKLSVLAVTPEGGKITHLSGSGNSRTFVMPAKNVSVGAVFVAIKYSINMGAFANGSVTASQENAVVGTSVTLTVTPLPGYVLSALTVIDEGGTSVALNGIGNSRTFTMPAKNVTVAATFSVMGYNIKVGAFANGSIIATPATATAGTSVTLTATPASGYGLSTLGVIDEDGAPVVLSGTGNSRRFTMPAKNVTVDAAFNAIKFNVNVGTYANGIVTATPATATIGTSVTLTATPSSEYALSTLTVTDEGGASLALSGTGNVRTFTMPATNVTVAAVFNALPPSGDYKKIGSVTIGSKEYDLVTFGLWPQTIMDESVTVNESDTVTRGDFSYCRGSDGQWYVKQTVGFSVQGQGIHSAWKFSDGTSMEPGDRWFKVEPIKWRVLTANYGGKKLLLAENILIKSQSDPDSEKNNYQISEIRKWLNCNADSLKVSDHGDSKGFLKTAFTVDQIAGIASVSVDNSVRTTLPDNYDSLDESDKFNNWNNGTNRYASNTPTVDKIFLLSVQEATESDYGLATKNERIRTATDFALATEAIQSENDGYGGWWRLRSSAFLDEYCWSGTYHNGTIVGAFPTSFAGVVPALCVEN